MQKLVDGQKLATLPSPLSGTNLTKTSGLSYNSMGGISSTPLATMSRPSYSVPAGPTSASSGGNSPTASAQSAAAEYFQTKSLNQSLVKKDLVQRPDDPVTEQGLYDDPVTEQGFDRRPNCLDDYNELGGRKGLREVMGIKWLRILEFTQGVSVPDESRGDSELRIFLESLFVSSNTQNFRLERAFGKIYMPRKALTVKAMQLYAASTFAAELDDQLPKIEDSNYRVACPRNAHRLLL